MKRQLTSALQNAVSNLLTDSSVNGDEIKVPVVKLDVPRNPEHGDFSCNIAMMLAKPLAKSPRDIAQQLLDSLGSQPYLSAIDIAGPGFLNFTLTKQANANVIDIVSEAGAGFGKSTLLAGENVLVEFVSANPTGPLHVGHGRGAAYGDAIASLLEAVGCTVSREYYVNDAGRQMEILTLSVWIRYLQKQACDVQLPENAYQGDYIGEIAEDLFTQYEKRFVPDEIPNIDTAATEEMLELVLDQSIATCRKTLGDVDHGVLSRFVCDAVIAGIKQDLSAFQVNFDAWFSEKNLVSGGALERAIENLEKNKFIYLSEGAKWFRSTDFDDEKDRVVVRENGVSTYFASDIAYHAEKSSRGFQKLINIWGADHHGYIARVRAAMSALGVDEKRLEIILVQFAALFRDGEKVAMSTRSGQFVTLKELVDEVGSDAARFFYLSRRADQHLDFDLDLAKSKSNENPVYYVQYAHARICSVFEQLNDRGFSNELVGSTVAAKFLVDDKEKTLLSSIGRFPELVEQAALNREPHLLTSYLRELAADFHAYYNGTKILIDDENLRVSRLSLINAVKQVLNNGLTMLRISAPQKM